ncbi:MAG: hypothetical protein ACU0DI_12025 [Paracoccaceae bacterium]
MRVMTIIVGAVFAMITAIGPASAADEFQALDDLVLVPMTSSEMAAVVGTGASFVAITVVLPDGTRPVQKTVSHSNKDSVAVVNWPVDTVFKSLPSGGLVQIRKRVSQ